MDKTALWTREKTDMGMNDHIPVPDPKPKHKYANPEEARKAEVWEAPLRKLTTRMEVMDAFNVALGDHFQKLVTRVGTLEGEQIPIRYDMEVQVLNSLDDLKKCVTEVKSKLKTTIKAVEKLAKGKSLGALGLPMEEDWK